MLMKVLLVELVYKQLNERITSGVGDLVVIPVEAIQ